MSFFAFRDYMSFPRFHVHVFQIWTAFKLFDKNGDGMVTKAEFRKVFQNQIASYRVEKMLHFKIELCLIKHKKCHISKSNLSFIRNIRSAAIHMTSQQIDLVFHRCDLDKDGKLNFDEFERWCISNQKINAEKRIIACLRMTKRHILSTGGLTVVLYLYLHMYLYLYYISYNILLCLG